MFWYIAVGAVVLDQATKALVRASFNPGQSVPVIDGVLHLTYIRNFGAAFGLLPGARPLFVATSVFVLLFVAIYWRRARPTGWPEVVALALVCGGAVGNLIDRIALGRVTDFVDIALIDFPVFNVADSAIVVGVGILIVWLLFAPDPADSQDRREPLAEADCKDVT